MKTNPKMHQTTNTDMLDDYTVSRKTWRCCKIKIQV